MNRVVRIRCRLQVLLASRALPAMVMLTIVACSAADSRAQSVGETETAQKPIPQTGGPEGMAWIPGGEFTMGSEDPLGRPRERPTHRVKVDGFWMDRTPVTNAQFRAFVEATGYVRRSRPTSRKS